MVKIINKITKTIVKLPSELSGLSSEQFKNLAQFAISPRRFIIGVLVLWIAEQIFRFAEAVLAQILNVFDLLITVPALLAQPFTAVGGAIGGQLLAILTLITDVALGLVSAAGPLAPLVAAVVFVLVLEAVDRFGPPLANAATDLLGAVPVVGSVLDAFLTFVIDVLGRFGGDS